MSVDPASTPDLAGLRRARAQEEVVRLWRMRLAPVFYVVIVVVTFQTAPHPGTVGRGLCVSVTLGGLALALVGVRATFQRTNAWSVPPVVVLVVSSAMLMWVQPNGAGAAGVLAGFILLARPLPDRVGVGLSVAAFGVLAAIKGVSGHGPNVWLLAMMGGFFGMMSLAQRLAAANKEAERLLVELQESRAAEAQAAVLAERQRLAREMHDVLAHSLSGLLLQLEGARMLAAEDPNDARLPEAIDRAHHLGKTGLEEARRAIGLLRDDELPGPGRLAALVAQFQEDRDIPCQFMITGNPHELVPEARLALYRVAQEALTNITKHAHPEGVEVCLAYEPVATRLTVEDRTTTNGTHSLSISSGGYGLTGMRERAELLGGTLTTETTPTGFRVELDVPA